MQSNIYRILRVALSLFFVLILTGCSSNQPEYDLIISNVNLIDGTGKPLRPNTNVFVKDGKIVKINSKTIQTDNSDRNLDGSGKYLIPGLIDAHMHLLDGKDQFEKVKRQMHQCIHYGITTILIPGGSNASYPEIDTLVQQERKKSIISPHIYYTSLICTIKGAHPMKTYGANYYKDSVSVYVVKGTDHIKHIVKEAAEHNALGMKIIVEDGPAPPFVRRMPANYVSAFSSESAKYNLKVFAHISDMEEAKICVNNGVDALMHFTGVRVNWQNDRKFIDKVVTDSISWVTTVMIAKSFYYPLHKERLDLEELRKVYGSDEIDPLLDADGSLEKESRKILSRYSPSGKVPPSKTIIIPMMQDIKKLYDKGVNIVMGTDVGGRPYILPGISVHEEMELMQQGGIPPIDIIKISTHNAAKMLGILHKTGTIEQEKTADMVLLNENPLEDISNTLSIQQVIKDGTIQRRIAGPNGEES